MKKKISIIIPVYNTQVFLRKCLDSIVNQTYLNLEIIIINDGSTDNSLEICKEFEYKDDRIILINQKNKGVSMARNKGLEIASGDYIGFVDSDDYICITMYEKLIKAAETSDADIAECGYYTTNEKYEVTSKVYLEDKLLVGSKNCSYEFLQNININYFNCTKIYKKSLLKYIKFSKYKIGEDHLFNSKAFYYCNKKVTISDVCYYYVRNNRSVTLKGFGVGDLERILSKKEIVNFYKKNRPCQVDLTKIHVLESIITTYDALKQASKAEQKKYKKMLISKFKEYYDENIGVIKKLVNKKRYIRILLFRINPDFFYYLTKTKRLIN